MQLMSLVKVFVIAGAGIGMGLMGGEVYGQVLSGGGASAAQQEMVHGGVWGTDMKAAMEQAKKEGKDLLVNFSGSDWCGPCQLLDRTIFSKKAFQDEAMKDFVLVNLDFPQQVSQSAELKKQNEEWAKKLGIRAFPTVVLMDAAGQPYAMTGLLPDVTPEDYAKDVIGMKMAHEKAEKLMAEAQKLKGIEKARKLDEAIELVGMRNALMLYKPAFEEIVELDKDNKAGLRDKYMEIVKGIRMNAAMEAAIARANKGDFAGAVEDIDKLLAEYKPEKAMVVQQILAVKAQLYLAMGDGRSAIATLEEAVDFDPKTPLAQNLQKGIESLQQQMDQLDKSREEGGEYREGGEHRGEGEAHGSGESGGEHSRGERGGEHQ